MSALDYSPLRHDLLELETGLALYNTQRGNTLMRDGVFHRFKLAFELAQTMLRRYLRADSSFPGAIDELTLQGVIQVGGEHGLIRSGWKQWSNFGDACTITCHLEDESRAADALAIIPAFLAEAQDLLERLSDRDVAG